ncbi:hypothetical protein A3C37_05500 [Candidatus Peribacteria bacterium RIFCSPHIGHO2_02_FULL_53_20]|nr:MAG: hypothetical protein A3C37_05500 [Candidatus Peribacteria bacterium RIFCSPHIGHO2_02_FULL_53_20]OGJ69608.1 MAG: hypothetical protein A3G69_01390 [Candidatus Peribacteria bacterium RIFCSPLOWO2_12_FULL_53_10]
MKHKGDHDVLEQRFASVGQLLNQPAVVALLKVQFGDQIMSELKNPQVVQMIDGLLAQHGEQDEVLDLGDAFLQKYAPDKASERQLDVEAVAPVLKAVEGLTIDSASASVVQSIFSAISSEEVQARLAARQPVKPIRNGSPQIGRNDPCPCGCGIKYKKCHANDPEGLRVILEARKNETQ